MSVGISEIEKWGAEAVGQREALPQPGKAGPERGDRPTGAMERLSAGGGVETREIKNSQNEPGMSRGINGIQNTVYLGKGSGNLSLGSTVSGLLLERVSLGSDRSMTAEEVPTNLTSAGHRVPLHELKLTHYAKM